VNWGETVIGDHRACDLQPRYLRDLLTIYRSRNAGSPAKSHEFMKTTNNKILVPTSFSPTK